ncbi:MAG: universal stress protein [Bacteroidales bacterium]|nr:universal stress protein [Bacteroidales bacterium]MBN2758157.1 universal stress protein [Bacteroidales bacterium]
MQTKNKILVPIDFDEQSIIALKYAEHFAELTNAELEVITVVEESGIFSKLFSTDELAVKINKEIQQKLDEAVLPYKSKININTQIVYGKPYEKILEIASKINPSFIFMGRSEMPKYKKAFVGSNAMHMILESIFPVITINGNNDFELYKKENKEILVPLDFEKETSEQLTSAIELAQVLKSGLRLITIQTSGGKAEEASLLSKLAVYKKFISEKGIICDIEIINKGNAEIADIINNQAIKNKSELIIIMTRQESQILGYFMGSTATDIINKSEIPVLTMKPWDNEEGSKVFSSFYDPLSLYKKK